MFEYTPQERRQFFLMSFYLVSFLGFFALAALSILVPEAAGPFAALDDFDMPTVGALLTAAGSLFLMTRT